MKTWKFFLLTGAVLLAAVTLLPAQTPVRVTAERVNLRAKAQPAADVVVQANYDDRLLAHEIGEEWVEVEAPAAADLWVMKSFVRMPENTIGANRVNVRAGPSINYQIVATLGLGDTVEPRGEEIQEWIKIGPPAGARLWISRDYVEILPGEAPAVPEAAAAAGKPAESGAAEPAVTAAAQPSPAGGAPAAVLATPLVAPSVPMKDDLVREIPLPAPKDLKLIPLEGQGRFTEIEGELRAAPLINEAPARYRVVRWQDNRWQILCHVYGEAAKLRSLQDQRVRVKGREYWIQGAAAPVLVPDQIQALGGE